ncbi:unnamed protein product, partial [marine sediment metagenome]
NDDARIIWQVVRSPFLKSEISEHLKVMALRIIDDTPFRYLTGFAELVESGYSPISQSPTFLKTSSVFFLCFGFSGNELLDLAKKDISQLIDKQEKNGSFSFDVLITCLSASSIHFTKLDWSGSVCDKAVEYILDKQNKEGYWDFLFGESKSHGDRTDWNVLSTVIALETLDFIKDDKPLPIWVPEEKHYFHDMDKQPLRVHTISPFPIPQDASWGEVYIRFLDYENAEITVLEESYGIKNFAVLRFENKKNHMPIKIWKTLYTLAKVKGVLEITDEILSEKERDTLEKRISLLRNKLKILFGTAVDPFHPYKKSNCYDTKFNISVREKIDDKIFRNDKIKEVYNSEIEKKEIQQARKIKFKRL